MEVSQYIKEKETIEYLDLKHLVPFRNHLFKLRDREVRLQNEMGSGKKIRKDFVVGCDKDEKR